MYMMDQAWFLLKVLVSVVARVMLVVVGVGVESVMVVGVGAEEWTLTVT